MKQNGRALIVKILILVAGCLLIRLFAGFGLLVERWYATGIYPVIAITLRAITGWVPFSLGDVLYALAIIWLIARLFLLLKLLFQRRATWAGFFYGLGKGVVRLLWIYLVFNIFWGLNYSRLGISYQLQLQPGRYSTDTLKSLTTALLQKVNESRKALGDSNITYPGYRQVFEKAGEAYGNAAEKYPFLHYSVHSVKKSLYSPMLSYFGFLGYYSPLTGEAQVGTDVPPFVTPYTACHEIAHQLGYGSESEANFVGYLSATASKDEVFHYSAYFDLFSYANGELFERDSAAARANYRALDTLVKRDFHIYRTYLLAHKNPIEPILSRFYGEYLKANNQPAGIDTYNEVVAWLIAYKKKYGII